MRWEGLMDKGYHRGIWVRMYRREEGCRFEKSCRCEGLWVKGHCSERCEGAVVKVFRCGCGRSVERLICGRSEGRELRLGGLTAVGRSAVEDYSVRGVQVCGVKL